MGSCKFRVRKDYTSTLNVIYKLFSPNEYGILGDTKYQQWISSCGYIFEKPFRAADAMTSVNYIGCLTARNFAQYIDELMNTSDPILYVISGEDLDKILISRQDLIKELNIDFSPSISLDDLLEDIKKKTGVLIQIGYAEKVAPSQYLTRDEIISKILNTALQQFAENRKNQFLFSLPWGGYKRNPRDRHEL